LPANLPKSRLVIACVLDRSGLIRNPRVLESGGTEMTAKVMAALPNWKFRPAMRGEEPVEVNAILGFNIDTR
jgi:outer membrane biosynthesis protein TonB